MAITAVPTYTLNCVMRHTGGAQADRALDASSPHSWRESPTRFRGDDPTRSEAAASARFVKRQFIAAGLNQLWVADMTYVPTWARFIYLAIVLDVWSRRIVGWAIGERMTADLVLAALNMGIAQRRPTHVIHHSDQGRSTPALRLDFAARRSACAARWEASATPTTMRWQRASLGALSAS
jgi:transposase InsO family protein